MTIKALIKKCHNLAVEKGFWDDFRNNSELLMLIVSELGEACEALRKDNRAKKEEYIKAYKESKINEGSILSNLCFEAKIKNTFEDEIADTMIRLFDLAGGLGIDLEWYIKKKLEYNKSRPEKHGKKF